MYTEMLDEGMVQDPDKQRKYIKVLRRESDRLSHLVENVLAFSRLEQRKLNVIKESRPLEQFVDQILSRGVELARQKEIPLHQNIPENLAAYMTQCDPDHVGQIVFNMIENAIKYGCPSPGSTIDLNLTIRRRKLLLSVRDHGPGVSPTFRRRLFKPFSKSDRDAADTSHGVGLGLALCRSLARQLRGDLRYVKVQTGACFELSLPIEKKS
jgi:signal transduction histidine kinase